MPVFFIADVHLSTRRPERIATFLSFLDLSAHRADRLYILGDLFDLWLGDDDTSPPHPEVVSALKRLTTSGAEVFAMHGNHDFTMGSGFEDQTGCRLLPDPSVVDIYGTPVLLMHGDTLCTDDLDYQEYRARIRSPETLDALLTLPLEERMAKAAEIIRLSDAAVQEKPVEIMDVNNKAVEEAMRSHGILHLIHGHTHRPAVHRFNLDGNPATRIVLGDWYQGDSVLTWDEGGYRPGRVSDFN